MSTGEALPTSLATAPISQPQSLVINPENLRKKVKAVIKPYGSNNTLPPFSLAEMMVMAWVCRRDDIPHITDQEISDWIFVTFGYHRKMALKELYQHGFQDCTVSYKNKNSLQDFVYQRALQLERLAVPLRTEDFEGDTVIRSTTASSRQFLRRALRAEPPSFTRFFDLPPELRMLIYEYVLHIDLVAVRYEDVEFDPKSEGHKLRPSYPARRSTRCLGQPWTKTLNYKVRRDGIEPWATEPTSEILSLLRVNRQIFEEAMPVFYRINHFNVGDIHDLAAMLSHWGARRRDYFTTISLRYEGQHSRAVGPKTAKRTFGLLTKVKRLCSLYIIVEDDELLKGSGALTAQSSSVEQIPGMRFLIEVRVGNLSFTGDCPRIKDFLIPRMLGTLDGEDASEKLAKKSGKKAKTA